jgi:hypothetical protein
MVTGLFAPQSRPSGEAHGNAEGKREGAGEHRRLLATERGMLVLE